jgi:T4 RnlA family RNA ligase
MFAQNLYDGLMALVAPEDSPFYSVDQVLDGITYRIFSYRLGGYQEFMKPFGLECRGAMFEIDAQGVMIRLASLPFEKFFNLNENPSTMGLDLSKTVSIQDKLDGSLISTFIHNGDLRFKSKTSVQSDQANDALAFINKPENKNFRDALLALEAQGATINLEWTAPHNRIVLPYQKPQLTVLNARVRDTGRYIGRPFLGAALGPWMVPDLIDTVEDKSAFLNSVKDMTGIEGYVIRLENGQAVKLKTDWYVALHRAKDSVNSPKALFEVVVNEAHDDLRAAFPDDAYLQDRINDMEKKVVKIYSDIKHYVEGFYAQNKTLDRKTFAIKAQAEVPKMWFGPLMSLYTGKQVDFKEYLIKRYKDFGIKDEPITE